MTDHFKSCARCGQVVITRAEVAVCAMCRAPAIEPRHEALCLFTPAPAQMPGQTAFSLAAAREGRSMNSDEQRADRWARIAASRENPGT
jgi:hypothetical protein